VHPEDRPARAAAIKSALKNHGEYSMEYRVLLPDGTLRWIGSFIKSCLVMPQRSEKGGCHLVV